jgi:subtilisin family serine protease
MGLLRHAFKFGKKRKKMKRAVSRSFFLGMGLTIYSLFSNGLISDGVAKDFTGSSEFIALLKPPSENRGAPRYDREKVVHYLKASLKETTFLLEQCLQSEPTLKSHVRIGAGHWINRSLTLSLANTPDLPTELLKKCPMIQSIHRNGKSVTLPTTPPPISSRSSERLAYNLIDIGLDRMLQENPHLRGNGSLIGVIDTGVDGKHPTLVNKCHRFLDAKKNKEVLPCFDKSGHGTHVAGILVGEDLEKGVRFGIAPDAKLMAAAGLDTTDTILTTMEWMMTEKNLHVVNNSWSLGFGLDPLPFYKAIESWEAAGILPVFSAGNAGPKPQSITTPHEHPLAFSIGATDKNESVLTKSSRGPGKYLGATTQKPDLTAPGDDIFSALPYRRTGTMAGTSMAAPHVAGAVAILLQMKPDLTPIEIRSLILSTLRLKSPQSWDPARGAGKLDLYAAVEKLKKLIHALSSGGSPRSPLETFFPSRPVERSHFILE